MMNLEFSFDTAPWEAALGQIADGGSICAAQLITLLEGETEESVEEALLQLELRGIALDIAGLPKPAATGETALRLPCDCRWRKNYLLPVIFAISWKKMTLCACIWRRWQPCLLPVIHSVWRNVLPVATIPYCRD